MSIPPSRPAPVFQEDIIKTNIVDFIAGFDYSNIDQLIEMSKRVNTTIRQLSWYSEFLVREIARITAREVKGAS